MILRLLFSFADASSLARVERRPTPRCSCTQFCRLCAAAVAGAVRASSVCVFGQ